ncbi:MAG: winged helix-turn-helix transcriptional regulator [Desulfobacteraceae bacterium]|jgi:DNA-binding MarR family transcriptional regulator
MDPKDIRTLKILEKVEQERLPSQRDLAKELNISLGLVNSFVKRLAKKGYFKITHIPRNRIKYILTPKGAAEKTRLTYDYIQLSYEFYKDARQKLQKIFIALQNQGVRQIIFYGATDLAEIAYVSLQETDIELIAVVDDLKVGKTILGFKIQEPIILSSLSFDRILITAVNSREIISKKLSTRGISPHLITEIQ